MRYLIIIIMFTSCVTEKGVQRYLLKHPEHIEKVFIHDEVHDTTILVKDSLITERITDSFYTWFADTKYIDRWRIKEVLKPCKDSVLIVTKRISTELYKEPYLKAKSDLEAKDKLMRWWRKGLLLTWAWIAIILIVVYIIKRK